MKAVNFLRKCLHFNEKTRSGNELDSVGFLEELKVEAIAKKLCASYFSKLVLGMYDKF